MTKKTGICCATIAVFVLACPVMIHARSEGPEPGHTGAPGDPGTCASVGCHSGPINSGGGKVEISLPAGNTGTYVPGQAMQILVRITDAAKSSYGFQMTARMGSGNASQAGDFTNTDSNANTSLTQVYCAEGSPKANGATCGNFPVQYIEHTFNGYLASLNASPKGSYTYAFNWTPPGAGSGPVTLYVAANCGTGNQSQFFTNVYTTSISLTEAAGGPTITGVFDAESARPSFTSGQWVAIYGSGLSNTTRIWNEGDFAGGTSPGSPLPTKLDGVSVTIGGQAAVYAISPTQLNVLSPSNLTPGPVSVVVTNNGSASAAFTGTVVQASPSFFYYASGANIYPLALHASNNKLVGDPTLLSGAEKAHPGEIISMYINGLAPSQGGAIVAVAQFSQDVTMSAGNTSLATSPPFLVAAGQFQVNATLPATLPAGNYTLRMTVPGGSTDDANFSVTLPVGP